MTAGEADGWIICERQVQVVVIVVVDSGTIGNGEVVLLSIISRKRRKMLISVFAN